MKSSVNATILIGGLITLFFLRDGLKEGLSIAGGVLFSLLNLYLWWRLIQEIITPTKRSGRNIAGVAVLKFFVLWGAFIAVMAFDWASPMHLGIGFTVLLFVFAMKGFGRWIVDYFNLKPESTQRGND